jgi:hypothetical protein
VTLVWHIAKKDLRRMALPTALWLVFLASAAVWFRLSSVGAGDVPVEEIEGHIERWCELMSTWSWMVAGLQFVICYLLTGTLVIEDALLGTQEFWMTRPIANWRLLAAKATAATLLFIVAPSLVLGLIDLVEGFSLNDVFLATVGFALRQLLVLVFAFAMASLARNLVQFVFCSIGLIVVLFLCVGMMIGVGGDPEPLVKLSRVALIEAWASGIAFVVALQQFAIRRPSRGWLTIALGFTVGIAIAVAWPYDHHRIVEKILFAAPANGVDAVAQVSSIEAVPVPADGTSKGGMRIVISGDSGKAGPRLSVPFQGSGSVVWPDGTAVQIDARLRNLSDLAEHAVNAPNEPVRWQLEAVINGAPAGAPKLKELHLTWSVDLAIGDEMPVRMGAVATRGASRAVVIGIEDAKASVYLVKHEVDFGDDSIYVLVDRATHQARAVQSDEVESRRVAGVRMFSQVVYFCRLDTAVHWDVAPQNPVIIEVRLRGRERMARLWRYLPIR